MRTMDYPGLERCARHTLQDIRRKMVRTAHRTDAEAAESRSFSTAAFEAPAPVGARLRAINPIIESGALPVCTTFQVMALRPLFVIITAHR